MVSYYSVIQYVPDPASNERINIGVAAYGEGQVKYRFLRDWNRVRKFGGRSTDFLEEFVDWLAGPKGKFPRLLSHFPKTPPTQTEFEAMTGRWRHIVQFSPPAVSTLEISDVLNRMAVRFLIEPPATRRRSRDKRAAVKVGFERLRDAIQQQYSGRIDKVLKRNYAIEGKADSYQFDFGIGNGHPLLGAFGVALRAGHETQDRSEIHDIAFRIWDIKEVHRKLPVSVIAVVNDKSELLQVAQRTMREVGATLVLEAGIPSWARKTASNVAKHL